MNQLVVNNRIVLTDFQSSDKDALVKHLNDPEIYDRTIGIPYPCTEGDAETALANLAKINTEQSHRLHWAVRTTDGALIGDCGFNGMTVGFSHKAEINYWLARPFWGQGIMTDVIRRLCRYGSDELSLVRIFAHVFLHNPASAKVLIKCGFKHEGVIRRHFFKDDRFHDALLYAWIHPSFMGGLDLKKLNQAFRMSSEDAVVDKA